ncbi:MAG TPA: L,D-transpeptidase [Vicinamibacterales bacterium]|nr:L,D-transpeptidase [Vicinamibacterales bacterium]
MSGTHRITWIAATAAILAGISSSAPAQSARHPRSQAGQVMRHRVSDSVSSDDDAESGYHFTSRSDSLSWSRNRDLARRSSGFRLVVSLQDRHLWAIVGRDTVLSAPVAVAKGTTLEYGSREWKFDTPRGMRTVLDKDADPIWQPPDWLYAETAVENNLKVAHLNYGQRIRLDDGRILTMVNNAAGLIDTDGSFGELPTDEHIVFGNTLYVPPMGSKNRKVEGELGKYKLNLGEGYLLHGTPDKESIGMAATHGCVRLRDDDIEWLYENVPVGTRVYIY